MMEQTNLSNRTILSTNRKPNHQIYRVISISMPIENKLSQSIILNLWDTSYLQYYTINSTGI